MQSDAFPLVPLVCSSIAYPPRKAARAEGPLANVVRSVVVPRDSIHFVGGMVCGGVHAPFALCAAMTSSLNADGLEAVH